MGITLLDDILLTVQNEGATLTINGEFDVEFNLTIDGNGDLNLSSGAESLEGSGNVIKNGSGTLTLAGDSTGFGGTITVNEGVLAIDGVLGEAPDSVGSLTLDDGTLLQGDGETVFEVTVNPGAEVRPGSSPGTLSVGNIVFEDGSLFSIEINGPVVGTEYSSLEATGTVTLNNPLLRIALGPAVTPGSEFRIIDNGSGSATAGAFDDLPEGQTFTLVGIDDIGFSITYQGGDGNDVVLQSLPTLAIDDVTVQEPGSGTATATFTVFLSEASNDTVTVDFATQDGSAVAPQDYLEASGTLTFAPGDTSQTIQVTVNSDGSSEPDETFFINLFNSTQAAVAVDQGMGTITESGGGGGGCSLESKGTGSGTSWAFAALILCGLFWRMRRSFFPDLINDRVDQ
jgi:autotransporter-associated beta strand protein